MLAVRWYKFLRAQGYTRYISLISCFYNSLYWYPEGTWPYGIKKKQINEDKELYDFFKN